MYLNDFGNNVIGGVSNKPGTALSGTTANNGNSKSLTGAVGQVQAVCMTGAATGSPTSYSVAFKLQESADDSSWSDISGATATITADNTVAHIKTGKRTMRYVRVVATPAFVGGTSPTAPVASYVFSQDGDI